MRIAVVADTFAPLRTSGAVQLGDLVDALARAGHDVMVLVPDHTLRSGGRIEQSRGGTVVRLACPKTKDVNSVRRLIAEFFMPYAMWRAWRKVSRGAQTFDGIVFYSPSIFFPPLIERLARQQQVRRYLIIRDIFPDWAIDIGKIKRGPIAWALKKLAHRQFVAADVIGVQTPGNLAYFKHPARMGQRIEVLHNWLAERPIKSCSIDLSASRLSGRKNLVYAGNIGLAQDLGIIIDLAHALRRRTDIGFVFVGRGTEVESLKARVGNESLTNVLFYDEIDPDEIPALYQQCAAGLVVLDPRHRTHNIPGKFISYVSSGLPVFAIVNENNDLLQLIREKSVGLGVGHRNVSEISSKIEDLLDNFVNDDRMAERCRALSRSLFSADAAASQVVTGLQG